MSQGHFSAPRGQSSEEGTGARPDTSSQKEGTVGLAFLITNSYTGANFLRGPAKDHDRWLRALEALHFDVRWEKNLTANRMKSFMEEIKKIRNFGTCNYVIFVFSGHGNATSFLGHDGKSVQGCELLSPLFKDNFQDVKKLLFLDACRTKPKGGYNPEDLIPPNSAKYYILYSSPLGGVANDEPEGSQFSKAVTQCIVGDCTIGDICGAALETGYHHAGESWIDTNGNLNQDDRNVKLKDLSRIGGSKDHLPAGAVSGSSSSLPPKAPAVDGGPKDHLPAGAVSGSSSSLPPKAPAVEVPTAPKAGMDEKIGSSSDILGVPAYRKGLIGQMSMLGTVLGSGEYTDAILRARSGSIDTKLMHILNRYITEKSPTWRDFCEALEKYTGFNMARENIEADHYASRSYIENALEYMVHSQTLFITLCKLPINLNV